jgi:hypothetical protein
MAPGIIAALLSSIPAIVQGIQGAGQMKKADQIEGQYPLPKAEIAPSVNKLVNFTYGQTLNQDIAGGGIARDEIKGATAAGMKAASEWGSGSEAYGMLGQLVSGQQDKFSGIAKLTAQDVAGKNNAYESALGIKAGEENRVWDWNTAQPYLQAASIAAKLRDSGTKNIFSGLTTGAGVGAEYAGNKDLLSSLLTNSNGKNGTISNDLLTQILNQIKGNSGGTPAGNTYVDENSRINH